MNKVTSFRDLAAYRSARGLQQVVFEASKKWPRCETFALTDQARRASRSVGANLAEAWAKRRYPAHFLSKLTDSDGELQETEHWLGTARECGYVSESEMMVLNQHLVSTGKLLGGMINRYQWFCYDKTSEPVNR